MPFLDWDRPNRYKTLSQELREIQRLGKETYELQIDQERQDAIYVRRDLSRPKSWRRPEPRRPEFWRWPELRRPNKPDSPILHEEIPDLLKSYKLGSLVSRVKRDHQGRILAGTVVGQVLLDVASLATAMSTYRDRCLLRRYFHSNGDMSYREPFVRQDPQTHRFSKKDILYQATVPRKHLHHMNIAGAVPNLDEGERCYRCAQEAKKEARMLMLGELWLWVLDENTILTCLAPRIGEDAESDSRDLQREIHQVLSDQLRHGLGCNVDNILTVILGICLSTMFKGLPKDAQDIDLMGIAESEIASLVRY